MNDPGSRPSPINLFYLSNIKRIRFSLIKELVETKIVPGPIVLEVSNLTKRLMAL